MTHETPARGGGPAVAIVLPVYNEGEAVEPVLRALSAAATTPHATGGVKHFGAHTTVTVRPRTRP